MNTFNNSLTIEKVIPLATGNTLKASVKRVEDSNQCSDFTQEVTVSHSFMGPVQTFTQLNTDPAKKMEDIIKVKRQPNSRSISHKNENFRNCAMVKTPSGWYLTYLPHGSDGVVNISNPAIGYKFFSGKFCALQFKDGRWKVYIYELEGSWCYVDNMPDGDIILSTPYVDEAKLPADAYRPNHYMMLQDGFWHLFEHITVKEFSDVLSFMGPVNHDKLLIWAKEEFKPIRLDKAFLSKYEYHDHIGQSFLDIYLCDDLILDTVQKILFKGFKIAADLSSPGILYLLENVAENPDTRLMSKSWTEINSQSADNKIHRMYFLAIRDIAGNVSDRNRGVISYDGQRLLVNTLDERREFWLAANSQITKIPGTFYDAIPFMPNNTFTQVSLEIEEARKLLNLELADYTEPYYIFNLHEDGRVSVIENDTTETLE